DAETVGASPHAVALAHAILGDAEAPEAAETGRDGGVERPEGGGAGNAAPGGESGAQTGAQRRRRHALVFNAISCALAETPDRVPLSVRDRATAAALTEVDAWRGGACRSRVAIGPDAVVTCVLPADHDEPHTNGDDYRWDGTTITLALDASPS